MAHEPACIILMLSGENYSHFTDEQVDGDGQHLA